MGRTIPPIRPRRKVTYSQVRCLGCGANHNDNNCPYCGKERETTKVVKKATYESMYEEAIKMKYQPLPGEYIG